MPVYVCVHEYCAYNDQRRTSDFLKLELQVAVSYQAWVLGAELQGQQAFLTSELSL